ncbi:hypothetical protein [Kitasatospora sp. NPDC059327]|uniref:hypothetical protein n=1 Tax=Kitasatospora sp. NPDC059327 TaxID=3346803 RepID=UPI00367B52C2
MELRRHDVDFLARLDRAARDGDPALARQALADVLHAARLLTARHRELAERVPDGHVTQAPAPATPATEASVSPRGETVVPVGVPGAGPYFLTDDGHQAVRDLDPTTLRQGHGPTGAHPRHGSRTARRQARPARGTPQPLLTR